MAETFSEVLYREDFFNGFQINGRSPYRIPTVLDLSGVAQTSDGWLTAPPRAFTMWGKLGDNADAKQPYGGTTDRVRAYLRFPVMDWNEVAGVFIDVQSYRGGQLRFDSSFSGNQGDKIYVVVQNGQGVWSTRQLITGTKGYAWSTRGVSLPIGENARVGIIVKTGPYSPIGVPQGETASPVYVSDTGQVALGQPILTLPRYFRISNIEVDYPFFSTGARSTGMTAMVNEMTTSAVVSMGRFATAKLAVGSSLLVATQVTPHMDLFIDSTMTIGNVDTGVEVEQTWPGMDITLTAPSQLTALSVSETGGFQVGINADMSVETIIVPTIEDQIRPLTTSRLKMTRPAIINGRPQTLRVGSTTLVTTETQSGQVIGRISPYSVEHVLPIAPTNRWLSIGAARDNDTHELTGWTPLGKPNGPSWTTPGAYRPQVENYEMRSDNQHMSITYPAVIFDSTKRDHLNITLPAGSSTARGEQEGWQSTWVMVGSFNRFRGMLRDSCPIFDLATTGNIDYSSEVTATRGDQSWAINDSTDPAGAYLGWHMFSDGDHTVSGMTYKADGKQPRFSEIMPYKEDTPVVLAWTYSGGTSLIQIMSIAGTGQAMGRKWITSLRTKFQVEPRSFSLGKARGPVPFGGLFQTGSMSIFEIAQFNRALSLDEMTTVQSYLAGVYAPASYAEPRAEIAAGRSLNGAPNGDGGILFTTNDPPSPYYLLLGGQATKIDDGSVGYFIKGGAVVVYVTQIDYNRWIAAFGAVDDGLPAE